MMSMQSELDRYYIIDIEFVNVISNETYHTNQDTSIAHVL